MNHTEFSSQGGKARAKGMTAKERKRIATLAAKSRWAVVDLKRTKMQTTELLAACELALRLSRDTDSASVVENRLRAAIARTEKGAS